MKWERDASKDALIMLLISLLILVLAGAIVGWEVFKEPPSEVSGKGVSTGFVSLCMDAPPDLVIGNMTAITGHEFYKNLSRNVTNPENYDVPIYFNNSPQDLFVIGNETGIINFTPVGGEVGNHTITFCVTHNICEGVNDCETTNFEILGNIPPNWTSLPDYVVNESDTDDGKDLICVEGSISCSYNISLNDYVDDFDGDPLTFSIERWDGDIAVYFPALRLNSNTGVIIINDSDDADVGVHQLLPYASDGFSNVTPEEQFEIQVLNREESPIWDNISHQYLCEDRTYSYDLSTVCTDPDSLHLGYNDIDGYASYGWDSIRFSPSNFEIIQFIPTDEDIGDHLGVILYAMDYNPDSPDLTENTSVDYTVIEFNDYPYIQGFGTSIVNILPPGNASPVENYYLDLLGIDEEDGNDTQGNLTFSMNFINESSLFNINSTTGELNFTPSLSWGGEHYLNICVRDKGLSSLHDNASLCGENGSYKEKCYNASIYIGNNTAPEIINWSPYNLSIEIREASSQRFSINYTDLENTSLLISWDFDSINVKNETVSPVNGTYSLNRYTYSPGYTEAGNHTLVASVFDGEFLVSITWNIIVLDVPEPEPPETSGGGGGAPGRVICEEMWECTDWTVCQLLPEDITYPIRGDILKKCDLEDVPEGYCGYKTRTCREVNNCGTKYDRPLEIQGCYYTPYPNCYDGIKNCHHGDCEILTDCGGPCDPCPTCSDNIRNQGELGIDCGGPCPACEPEKAKPSECGNKVCRIEEIFTCPSDCWPIWITLLVVFITLLGFKEGLDKISDLKKSRIKKDRIHKIESISKSISKAIDEKDIDLARELYSEARNIFKKLPEENRLEMYPKLTESLEKIKKYVKKK